MNNETRIMLRQCSVGLLGGLFVVTAFSFKKIGGWEIPFNLLAMFGALIFAKIVIEKLTKEKF